MAGESVVYKKYINVGIAVDTENGLLVPVIRNADRKNLIELSVEIHQLAEKAKARKLTLEEMSGGSMSISNLGGIGGTSFTPIVNWPEVAILGHLARWLRAGLERHGLRAAADAAAVAQLRPPPGRRRRRDSLPALGRRGAGAAFHARAKRLGPLFALRLSLFAAPSRTGEAANRRTAKPAEHVYTRCSHRCRPRRLYGRVLRGRPRHAGHAHRRGEESRRRLPLSRLHPVEGACCMSPK